MPPADLSTYRHQGGRNVVNYRSNSLTLTETVDTVQAVSTRHQVRHTTATTGFTAAAKELEPVNKSGYAQQFTAYF